MTITALALLWLLWRMGGAVFALGAAGLLAVIFLVLIKQDHAVGAFKKRIITGGVLLGILILAALPFAYAPPLGRDDTGLLGAMPYSEQALAKARIQGAAQGRDIFVYFTADWCVTCKLNEQVAIERKETRAAFKRGAVIALRGDWTNGDPQITRMLEAQGLAGVPLYLWYRPGEEAQILPQILSPGALSQLADRRGSHKAP